MGRSIADRGNSNSEMPVCLVCSKELPGGLCSCRKEATGSDFTEALRLLVLLWIPGGGQVLEQGHLLRHPYGAYRLEREKEKQGT